MLYLKPYPCSPRKLHTSCMIALQYCHRRADTWKVYIWGSQCLKEAWNEEAKHSKSQCLCVCSFIHPATQQTFIEPVVPGPVPGVGHREIGKIQSHQWDSVWVRGVWWGSVQVHWTPELREQRSETSNPISDFLENVVFKWTLKQWIGGS